MAVAEYLPKQEVIPADSEPTIDCMIEPSVIPGPDQLDQGCDLSECPECQSELTQYYDWDTAKYRCENCGILINNLGFLKEES